MDRFGELIGDALREEAGRRHLPPDFAQRLMCGTRAGEVPVRGGLPRWLKVAALFAAAASFAAFAAVVGRVVFDAPEAEEAAVLPSAPEAKPISGHEVTSSKGEGENTMIARKMATLVGAAMVTVAVPAETIESEPTFVFLRPETSSFWNTATNNTMTVPIDYPAGATKATLQVNGLDYSSSYSNITGPEWTFELPAVTSPETENVYDLTLSFDDAAKTVRTAKLGIVQSFFTGTEGTTRCLAPQTAKVWKKVNGRAVLPIPYGTTSFTLNGVETDTGLDGAQGWYAIGGLDYGQDATLELVANGVQHVVSLLGGPGGLMLILK